MKKFFLALSSLLFAIPGFAGLSPTVVGGGTPGGSNTQVQYNNSSAFGGITNATSDGTTMTLTSPKIVTGLNDTNGNSILAVSPTASATNKIQIANASNGSGPTISAIGGSDTNIPVAISPLGTSALDVNNGTSAVGIRIRFPLSTAIPGYTTGLVGVGVLPTTDTVGIMNLTSTTRGGAQFTGLTNSNSASVSPFTVAGIHGNTSPGARAAVLIDGRKSDGGTATVALASTETILDVNNNGVNYFRVTGGGIGNNSGGLKHSRVTTGSIAGSASAAVTVTWTTAFADANYTVNASVLDTTTGTSALRVHHIESQTASAVIVRVVNDTVATAITGTVNVIAMHD